MGGWILLALIAIFAAAVLYASDQPGHRRRGPDKRYQGPERRDDKTSVDFFEQPVFTSRYCKDCDRVKRMRGECPTNSTCSPQLPDEL